MSGLTNLLLLSLAMSMVGCSGGSVNFGNGGRDDDSYSAWPDTVATAALTEINFPELTNPAYAVYANHADYEYRNSEGLLGLLFVPRAASLPVVEYLVGKRNPKYDMDDLAQNGDLSIHEYDDPICKVKRSWNIDKTTECGTNRGCIELTLTAYDMDGITDYCFNDANSDPGNIITEHLDTNMLTFDFHPSQGESNWKKVRMGASVLGLSGGLPELINPIVIPDNDRFLVWGADASTGEYIGKFFDRTADEVWSNAIAREDGPLRRAVAVNIPLRDGIWSFDGTDAMRYKIQDNAWQKFSMTGGPEFGTGLLSVVAATGDGIVYLAGSHVVNGDIVGSVYAFNLADGTWSSLPSPGAIANKLGAMIWAGARLYLSTVDGKIWTYDIQGRTWSEPFAMDTEVDSVEFTSDQGTTWVTGYKGSSAEFHAHMDLDQNEWDSVRSSIRKGEARLNIGNWTFRLGGQNGSNFYGAGKFEKDTRVIFVPHSPGQERSHAATTYANGSVFVWGGCREFVDSSCIKYRNDGFLLRDLVTR